jgi:hypothetical protein
MDITNIRISGKRLAATIFAIACAFVAYKIVGGSVSRFWHPLLGLVFFIAFACLLAIVAWGFFQPEHKVYVVRWTAIALVVVAVLVTIFARHAVLWWFHLWSIRGVVGAIVFAFGLFVASVAQRKQHVPAHTDQPVQPLPAPRSGMSAI